METGRTAGKAARESRVELSLISESLPQVFRDLAAALEGGPGGALDGVDLHGCAKLKVEVRRKAGRAVVKLKAKHEESGGAASPSGRQPKAVGPKYGPLKKRLKRSWKVVREAVLAGRAPDAALAEAFVADSERMVAFPAKGDEYYAPYQAALESFRAALKSGDAVALRAACDELERVKVQCHARYK
ncbi:GAK system XXXCH domain-containing protein [Desulfovibrio aminophilus]|uniref:GAK system XXXCH domain-containing protein n=1 Tax=Desulfovibrio aminophilus TaxID=81425 RepID=UPI003398FDFE